ncbi:LysR substrate-binding domain-containing protein, partial [Streptomyces sparsus]
IWAALGTDRCDVLLPAAHPLAARDVLVRADLGSVRWICQPPGTVCHDWLVRTARAAGQEPVLAHLVAEFETQLALVAAGLGVAVVPRLGRGPLPPGVVVRPLRPAPVRNVFALWRAGAARRPAITETVRALRRHYGHAGSATAPGASDAAVAPEAEGETEGSGAGCGARPVV